MTKAMTGGVAGLASLLAAPWAVQAQDAAQGRDLYDRFCAACHGANGQGDGVMQEVLTLSPTDLTGLTAEAQGEFPLVYVIRRIDGRHPILAHGGEMPLFGSWFEGDGPDVALSGPGGQPVMVSRPIADLVAYLEQLQR